MHAVQFLTWVLVTGVWATQAQVYGRAVRTYHPPYEPCYPTPPCYSSSDDLSSLLALAKLLEHDHDRTTPNSSNSNDINTGVIIEKLINALVYTTTHCASGGSNDECNTGSSGASGDRDGLIIGLIKALLGSGGNGGSGSGGSGSGGGGSGGWNSGGSSSSSNVDQGLIDLNLLGRNELLSLLLGDEKLLRLGIGSKSTQSTTSSIVSSDNDDGTLDVGGLVSTIL